MLCIELPLYVIIIFTLYITILIYSSHLFITVLCTAPRIKPSNKFFNNKKKPVFAPCSGEANKGCDTVSG